MNEKSSHFFHLESLAAGNVTAVSTFIYNVSARQVQTISVRGIKDPFKCRKLLTEETKGYLLPFGSGYR